MSDTLAMEQLVSGARLRLQRRAPFFATLTLFAPVTFSDDVPVAVTDGTTIVINPTQFAQAPPTQQEAILLHTILHAALRHVPRRGTRDATRWNLACDIAVNGMIAQHPDLELPIGSPRDPELEQLSVEEIYDRLPLSAAQTPLINGLDLQPKLPNGVSKRQVHEADEGTSPDANLMPMTDWERAIQHAQQVAARAEQVARSIGGRGGDAGGRTGEIDWRTYLWRFLAQTPNDFQDFDRRYIGRRLYLEALSGETVHVYIAVDTSGSVNEEQIGAFLAEVQSITRVYPQLVCTLFYADDDLHGPYALSPNHPPPTPVGGGGTSFAPFFHWVAREHPPHEAGVLVYLTDGFGFVPRDPPILPLLWVLTEHGTHESLLDYGDVARLV